MGRTRERMGSPALVLHNRYLANRNAYCTNSSEYKCVIEDVPISKLYLLHALVMYFIIILLIGFGYGPTLR